MYALARSPNLAPTPWRALLHSLDEVFSKINARSPVICGQFGNGPPVLDDARIQFNGNLNGRKWWESQGRPRLDHGYDDAHEDFELKRVLVPTYTGYFHCDVTTADKPYSIGVRAALLLTRHYYPNDSIITRAPGTMDDWFAAYLLILDYVPDARLPPECYPRVKPIKNPPLRLGTLLNPPPRVRR